MHTKIQQHLIALSNTLATIASGYYNGTQRAYIGKVNTYNNRVHVTFEDTQHSMYININRIKQLDNVAY